MSREFVSVLLRRRSAVDDCGQTWESSPVASHADASHLADIDSSSSTVPCAAEWLRNRVSTLAEEDPLRDAFDEVLKFRGPRPAHAPAPVTTDDSLQEMTRELASLQRQLREQNSELMTGCEDVAKREVEVAWRERELERQRECRRIRENAQRDYPLPHWLDNLEGKLNIALIGTTGVGKSLLINQLRRVRPGADQWAPVGVNETTLNPTMYTLPGDRRVRLWDLPGAGTENFPEKTYVAQMGLRYFDSVLIVTACRFTTMEMELREELEGQKVPFFMVRTKVDLDVWNNKEDNGIDEETTVQNIRNEFFRHGIDNPYLISSRDADKYDMQRLLFDAFPGLKQHMDGIDFLFAPANLSGWSDSWAMPRVLSTILSSIQGQWLEKATSSSIIIDCNEMHVTFSDNNAAVVNLVETDGRVTWNNAWSIDQTNADTAKRTNELIWSPEDSKLKPLIWQRIG